MLSARRASEEPARAAARRCAAGDMMRKRNGELTELRAWSACLAAKRRKGSPAMKDGQKDAV